MSTGLVVTMELVRSPLTSSVAEAPASVYVSPSVIVIEVDPVIEITGGVVSREVVDEAIPVFVSPPPPDGVVPELSPPTGAVEDVVPAS